MPVQLWHHLKARSLSSQKPLHRLSITCFIHPVSSQVLAKKSCEENEGFSTAHGALASEAWWTSKSHIQLRHQKRDRDNNVELTPGSRFNSGVRRSANGSSVGLWAPEKQLSQEPGRCLQLDAALLRRNQVGQGPPWSRCSLLVPRLGS